MKGFINRLETSPLNFLWYFILLIVWVGFLVIAIDVLSAGKTSEGFAYMLALMWTIIAGAIREENIALKQHLNEVIRMCERQQRLLDLSAKTFSVGKIKEKKQHGKN